MQHDRPVGIFSSGLPQCGQLPPCVFCSRSRRLDNGERLGQDDEDNQSGDDEDDGYDDKD